MPAEFVVAHTKINAALFAVTQQLSEKFNLVGGGSRVALFGARKVRENAFHVERLFGFDALDGRPDFARLEAAATHAGVGENVDFRAQPTPRALQHRARLRRERGNFIDARHRERQIGFDAVTQFFIEARGQKLDRLRDARIAQCDALGNFVDAQARRAFRQRRARHRHGPVSVRFGFHHGH